jgi:hypothetical protein
VKVVLFRGGYGMRMRDDLWELADTGFSPTALRNATAFGFSPRLRADIVLNNLVGHAVLTGTVRVLSDGTPWWPLVHAADIAAADPRSYRVNFSRLHAEAPAFTARWSIPAGAAELAGAYGEYGLSRRAFEHRFTPLDHLTARRTAGTLGADLRPSSANSGLARSGGQGVSQLAPAPGGPVPLADRRDRQRPRDGQLGIVVAHRQVLGRIVCPVDPVTDVGLFGERLEPVQQTWRYVEVVEGDVVQPEGLVPAEGGRLGPGVDQHVEHRAARAADQLGLAGTGAAVHSPDSAPPRPRLTVLDELGQAVLGGRGQVERPGEEPAIVVVRCRAEHEHSRQRRLMSLHPAILAAPVPGRRADPGSPPC